MDKKITIITHSGGFHADDVFAVATLHLVLDKENIEVIRSRDQETIEKADYVVDVGFVHDPDNNRFDHHQKEGAGKRENGIPYASFGLVWKKFGESVCGSKEISNVLDERLVQTVDGPDTGMVLAEPTVDEVWPYTLGSVVASFDPTWGASEKELHERFMKAIYFAKDLLANEIKKTKQRVDAEVKLKEIYELSKDKRILVFENARGWSRAFLSTFFYNFPEPVFIVRQHYDETWQLICVQGPAYKLKKSLPKGWAGKSDKELEEATGVSGAKFCHRERFMCITETKEGAIDLAKKALED